MHLKCSGKRCGRERTGENKISKNTQETFRIIQINVTRLTFLSIIEWNYSFLTDVPCVAGIPVSEVSIHNLSVTCVMGASKGGASLCRVTFGSPSFLEQM